MSQPPSADASEMDVEIQPGHNDSGGGGEEMAVEEEILFTHPLLRDATDMEPVQLATGVYGSRGERIRHLAHRGALKLPRFALERFSQDPAPKLSPVELPAMEAVLRPTQSGKDVVLTHLVGRRVNRPDGSTTVQTLAQNRTIPATERIRGGGGEADEKDPLASLPALAAAAAAAAAAAPSECSAGGSATGTLRAPAAAASVQMSAASVAAQPSQTAPTVPQPQGGPPAAKKHVPATTPSTTQHVAPVASQTPLQSQRPNQTHQQQQSSTQIQQPPQQKPAPETTPVSTTEPTTVASSTGTTQAPVAPAPGAAPAVKPKPTGPAPKIIPLTKAPASQWEQHKPEANDPIISTKDTLSEQLPTDEITDLERRSLSEWFDESAPHRTPKRYLKSRNHMIRMSQQLKNRYVTSTMVRRVVAGDAGSLLRLHAFLTSHRFMNAMAAPESVPYESLFQDAAGNKVWTDVIREKLVEAVVLEAEKKEGDPDWDAVAAAVGNGFSSTECEQQFLTLPNLQQQQQQRGNDVNIDNNRPITPDGGMEASSVERLVRDCDPKVLRAATIAALRETQGNVSEAQKSAVAAVMVASFQQDLQKLNETLSTVVDLRMKKLEARMTMLDEVEAMLEAERVALELERRDLYTARCRHWYQGS